MIDRYPGIAATIGTQTFAKRKMYVYTDSFFFI